MTCLHDGVRMPASRSPVAVVERLWAESFRGASGALSEAK